MKETDLYQPIHDYLIAQGYIVQAEVNHCDITAVKGDDLIVIELKRQFGIDLLVQATDRQSITDSVYVALPGPLKLGRRSQWRKKIRLLRRLELGLIVVTFKKEGARIEVVCHPQPYQRQRLKRRKRAVLEEINNRSGSFNQGGSVKKKLMTAYRENAIQIACFLERLGPLSPKRLRALGTGPKTLSILSNNHYKWFKRVERGVYDLTALGTKELGLYPELALQYRRELDNMSDET